MSHVMERKIMRARVESHDRGKTDRFPISSKGLNITSTGEGKGKSTQMKSTGVDTFISRRPSVPCPKIIRQLQLSSTDARADTRTLGHASADEVDPRTYHSTADKLLWIRSYEVHYSNVVSEYGGAPELGGGGERGNGRSPRKPANQRYRPARFPLAKIRRPGQGLSPVHLGIGKFREFSDVQARLHSPVYTRASDACSLAATPESRQCYPTPGSMVFVISFLESLLYARSQSNYQLKASMRRPHASFRPMAEDKQAHVLESLVIGINMSRAAITQYVILQEAKQQLIILRNPTVHVGQNGVCCRQHVVTTRSQTRASQSNRQPATQPIGDIPQRAVANPTPKHVPEQSVGPQEQDGGRTGEGMALFRRSNPPLNSWRSVLGRLAPPPPFQHRLADASGRPPPWFGHAKVTGLPPLHHPPLPGQAQIHPKLATPRVNNVRSQHSGQTAVPNDPLKNSGHDLENRDCPEKNRDDKLDVQHVYTEARFAIGSQFIRHTLDNSGPIADFQGNKIRGFILGQARIQNTCVYEPLVYTEFDTYWRMMVQSLSSTVTADKQCIVDIGIFVQKNAEFNLLDSKVLCAMVQISIAHWLLPAKVESDDFGVHFVDCFLLAQDSQGGIKKTMGPMEKEAQGSDWLNLSQSKKETMFDEKESHPNFPENRGGGNYVSVTPQHSNFLRPNMISIGWAVGWRVGYRALIGKRRSDVSLACDTILLASAVGVCGLSCCFASPPCDDMVTVFICLLRGPPAFINDAQRPSGYLKVITVQLGAVIEKNSSKNTFRFSLLYLELIAVLLNFVRASRVGHWKAYVTYFKEMLKLMAFHDHVNYMRWGCAFIVDIKNLDNYFPAVYAKSFLKEIPASIRQHNQLREFQHIKQSSMLTKPVTTPGGLVNITSPCLKKLCDGKCSCKLAEVSCNLACSCCGKQCSSPFQMASEGDTAHESESSAAPAEGEWLLIQRLKRGRGCGGGVHRNCATLRTQCCRPAEAGLRQGERVTTAATVAVCLFPTPPLQSRAVQSKKESLRIYAAANGEPTSAQLLTERSGEPMRMIEANMERRRNEGVGGNRTSPRKTADQRHRPAQFPLAKVRWPGRGLKPTRLGGRQDYLYFKTVEVVGTGCTRDEGRCDGRLSVVAVTHNRNLVGHKLSTHPVKMRELGMHPSSPSFYEQLKMVPSVQRASERGLTAYWVLLGCSHPLPPQLLTATLNPSPSESAKVQDASHLLYPLPAKPCLRGPGGYSFVCSPL
ncbi:hypothetical protein PR048_024886 [Dryococelus australis]|uniref:Uncharacterized protein n=1 Tax=Dryococelus australis TaxID=614101 RepID=A0ABQ9GPV1_9NEOP|nr:hypothetical protein PR048_024886 [Dryococelus australis]